MKYFIQIIGANATGKSSLAGWIIDNFDNSQAVGKYKKREQNSNLYKGGADPLKFTNQERRNLLQKIWMSDKNIILMQGMIVLSKLNIDYFLQLQEKFYRKIIIIHLFCSIKVLQDRTYQRSGGKPKTKQKIENLREKTIRSASIAKYAEEKGLKVINVCCDDINAYDWIKKQLKEELK